MGIVTPLLVPRVKTHGIGQYGLGSMGIGMALNLQKHLKSSEASPLVYSNRTLARGDVLKAEGATPVEDFKSVVKASDVIFTMVGRRKAKHSPGLERRLTQTR